MFNKSVFRLAQGVQYKDRTMPVKGAGVPAGQCMGLAASHQFIAAPYGTGGNLTVLPINFSDFKRDDNPPFISAHSSSLADFKFSPFNASLLATGAEDGVVKLWEVPSGGLTSTLSEPKVKLDLSSPVRSFDFHPSASGVLAVGNKDGACVLDLEQGAVTYNFPVSGAGKDTLSVSWQPDGGRLALLGKNSAIHLFDPRQAAKDQMETFASIDSKKPQFVFFVKDKLVLLAQNSSQKPFLAYYDPANLSKAWLQQDLNLSAGIVLPMYDPDTDLLFLAPRGATMLSIFDLTEQKKGGGPSFTAATNVVLDNGAKGGCLVPKSAVDPAQNEIQRFLSLTANSVEQYGVKITRKIMGFNEELYPNTNDCSAALSSADYFAGKNAELPKIHFLKLVEKSGGAAGVSLASLNIGSTTPATETSSGSATTEYKAPSNSVAPPAVGSPRKLSLINPSAKRADLNQKLKTSVFKHIDGNEPREIKESFYRLNPFLSAVYMSKGLKANAKYLAMPSKLGNGSTLLVLDAHTPVRGSDSPFVLRGHKCPINAFDLSHIDDSLIASGDQNGGVRVWKVPEGGLKADLNECVVEFQAKGKITVCQLSETVDSLLATACSSGSGHCVQVWDVRAGVEKSCIEGFHGDSIIDIQFDPYGHLLATTCKDGKVRVLDVRAQTTIAILEVKECLRDTQVIWISRNLILVIGTGKGSRRSLSLWDISSQTCLKTHDHDMNSATYLPYYDRSIGILWTANNGGMSIDIWEISQEAPYIEHLRTHTSLTQVQAFAFLPKRTGVNVKAVQIAKSYKLVEDKVIPMTWTVPRKRLQFFQDDLFLDVWDGKPICTSTEWWDGQHPNGQEPNLISLKPNGMDNLSSAPEEELTVREQRYLANLNKDNGPKVKGALGHENADQVAAYFTEVAKDMPKTNRFDAAYNEASKSVDDSEWD